MKLGSFHKALTFSNHIQPWRESPNNDINLLPNSPPLTSQSTNQTDGKAQTGICKQQLSDEWWPG